MGAIVYASAPRDAKSASQHYEGSVTVDLPKNAGDTVYLYTHFEKLSWFDTDDEGQYVYKFVEWRYDDNRTEYGDYKLVDTEYGDYELVDTEYGDYELVDTEYGDYELVDTEYGDYELVDTKYGDYKLVDRYEDKERVDVDYTGTLTLTVNGEEKPLNEDFYLAPGEYTFTITGSGTEFAPVSKTVTITPGDNGKVIFDDITYRLDDVVLETVTHNSDKEATVHEADKEATIHEENKEATIHKENKEAVKHYENKETTMHYDNEVKDPIYLEEYIYKADIKLGNELDAFGEHSVRLN